MSWKPKIITETWLYSDWGVLEKVIITEDMNYTPLLIDLLKLIYDLNEDTK